MDITRKVNRLAEIHQTRDPFTIARGENIVIEYDDFEDTKGYFLKIGQQKVIVINQNLDEFMQICVAAHELGHALLHHDSYKALKYDKGIYFMDGKDILASNSIKELQANQFAAELLIHEDNCFEYTDFTRGDQRTYQTLINLKHTDF